MKRPDPASDSNDSYAVERFDFSRGPNAILFGNGSLGGVASTMTKQARFDSAFTQLTQGVGSWSNFRTTLDVNRPLGERVAVRAALVDAHSEGWRDKQFDKIRAAFVTVSWKVARHTTLRVEGEYGEARRNQTFSNLADQLSGESQGVRPLHVNKPDPLVNGAAAHSRYERVCHGCYAASVYVKRPDPADACIEKLRTGT